MSIFKSILLIAGTAIGAGTLALPMVLLKLGFLQATIVMVVVWLFSYFSALINLELLSRIKKPMILSEAAYHYGGRKSRWVALGGFGLLCLALITAYLNGLSDLLAQITPLKSHTTWVAITVLVMFALLNINLRFIGECNRIVFLTMMAGFFMLIAEIIFELSAFPAENLLVFNFYKLEPNILSLSIPLAFTSFGFHVLFHVVYQSLDGNLKAIKKAFFWGSIIPFFVYVTWTIGLGLFIKQTNYNLFLKLISQNVSLGDFSDLLAQIGFSKVVVFGVSLTVMYTSLFGVAIALHLAFKSQIASSFYRSILTLAVPTFAVIFIPNAFLKALDFAGMILVFIAVFVPYILLEKSTKYAYEPAFKIVDNKVFKTVMLAFGACICLAELYNVFTN